MIFLSKDTELDTKSGLSIIYFYASYLLFHKSIVDTLAEIEKIYKDIKLFGVDVEQFRGLIIRYNISSLPTILISRDEGKIIKNIIGLQAISNIKDVMRDIYTSYAKGD
jgi:thiol-disulfide isomerase/thioredoxin